MRIRLKKYSRNFCFITTEMKFSFLTWNAEHESVTVTHEMLHMKVILTFILELEDDDYDGWNCNWWTEANSNFLPQFMSMRCTDLVLVYVMVMIMNINIKQITTHITHLSKTFCKIIYADLFSNTESYRPRLKFFSRIMKIHKIVALQSMFMGMGIFFTLPSGWKTFPYDMDHQKIALRMS